VGIVIQYYCISVLIAGESSATMHSHCIAKQSAAVEQMTKERITMKRKLLAGSLMVTFLGLPMAAMASEQDCFPLCAEPAKAETKSVATEATTAEVKLDPVYITAHRDVIIDVQAATSCDSGLMKTADDINDKVKPIREIVGYVRSPQGLLIKLVNDYVIKIPAWIGYAMDPLGSLKHKAIDEVRTRARDAANEGSACAAESADPVPDSTDAVDEKHSI
jgi:hypothetical protein